MSAAAIRRHIEGLPGATVSVQWGDDHVYKVGGKMFAVMRPPEAKQQSISFKAGEDSFAILTQAEGIIPAPYLARAKWVYLDRLSRLPVAELKAYLGRSHALVAAGLTRKARADLGLA
jgi:predicted DNA-binding protein (MmcQ/YjbR family)